MDDILALLNTAAVAGGIGGIVRFSVFRESPAELFRNIFSGSLTAHYLAPTASVGILNAMKLKVLPEPLTHDVFTGSVAFIIGFFGAYLLVFMQEKFILHGKKIYAKQGT